MINNLPLYFHNLSIIYYVIKEVKRVWNIQIYQNFMKGKVFQNEKQF